MITVFDDSFLYIISAGTDSKYVKFRTVAIFIRVTI